MQRSLVGGLLVALATAGAATVTEAQETFTPVFKAPYRAFQTSEFGVSFSDPGEGANFALEGFYSVGRGPHDFGLRVGFMDTDLDETIFLVGGNFRTRVVSYSESFPLDGALTLGFGGAFDGGSVFSVPIGISLGRRVELEGSNVTFVPYAHPVLQPRFRDGDDDVLFTLGLGVDIRLSRKFDLRVSGAIGDLEGVAVSAAFLR